MHLCQPNACSSNTSQDHFQHCTISKNTNIRCHVNGSKLIYNLNDNNEIIKAVYQSNLTIRSVRGLSLVSLFDNKSLKLKLLD